MSTTKRTLSAESLIVEVLRPFVEDPTNRAINYSGECMYRGDNSACAVGRCIPDSRYQSRIENKSAWQVHEMLEKEGASRDELLYARYRGHDVELWGHLQRVHDMNRYWEDDGLSSEGLDKLRRICTNYGADPARVFERLGIK